VSRRDGLPFIKGHGTENDFVVLPEPPADLGTDLVRALCDRRAGIGADGVLAVVSDGDGYFMDYRNADGSLSETCGNGIRVFARYLVESGRQTAGRFVVGTRNGPCPVDVPEDGGDITVEMGTPERLTDGKVTVGDSTGALVTLPAHGWSMGNPHLVVLDAGSVADLDLSRQPAFAPAESYPAGVNIEFVEPVGERHLRMRVHERGVGETRSCGSGACAAAVAVMAERGERSAYVVDVPGGRLVVSWREDGVATLAGPAVLVAHGRWTEGE
jgi:diaminopimelate epimerase